MRLSGPLKPASTSSSRVEQDPDGVLKVTWYEVAIPMETPVRAVDTESYWWERIGDFGCSLLRTPADETCACFDARSKESVRLRTKS
mmetsp:Transcript_11062/g.35158  ORF Transcript_11062/g.35158 Transcript_11062/m.35158 type:complete len:87 (+) Transcript_11062:39-299(+)